MELSNKHKKDIFVLAGDFNLPDINWSEQTISSNQYTVGTNQTYLDCFLWLVLVYSVVCTRGVM
jgi:hypothetical protein